MTNTQSTKHTSERWMVDSNPELYVATVADTSVEQTIIAENIDTVEHAKLIAQAPAMAEALRRHLDMIEQGGSIVGGYDYQDEMCEVLRDAGVLA